eukprot:TRINITY_DN3038_c1_g1_i2.p1 TRINITY_DN3038_c1_g1~~TRINITY_DN3038_c1_g1_i2.p1  ORF type:complete len:135 (+),score=21.94 TRINITY_DN3038_c1_g1_i2:2-406(+)
MFYKQYFEEKDMYARRNSQLPPEVNKILFVKHLPYDINSEEMYDLFGKFGAIRQIRIGNKKSTKGTAYVVYEDIYDAKNALEHLEGFKVKTRYIIVLYYQKAIMQKKFDAVNKRKAIEKLKAEHGVSGSSDAGG